MRQPVFETSHYLAVLLPWGRKEPISSGDFPLPLQRLPFRWPGSPTAHFNDATSTHFCPPSCVREEIVQEMIPTLLHLYNHESTALCVQDSVPPEPFCGSVEAQVRYYL